MLSKVRNCQYVVPKSYSCALTLLLTEVCPPPEYPAFLCVMFMAKICSVSSLLVQLLCKSPAHRLRNLDSFQMQPLFRGLSFDPLILQKTPADSILQLRTHPDLPEKARRGLSMDDFNNFDCDEVSLTLAKMDLSL